MSTELTVGLRAKFFHPKTFGVMHWGEVVRIAKNGERVLVHFDVDNRKHWTFLEHISPQTKLS